MRRAAFALSAPRTFFVGFMRLRARLLRYSLRALLAFCFCCFGRGSCGFLRVRWVSALVKVGARDGANVRRKFPTTGQQGAAPDRLQPALWSFLPSLRLPAAGELDRCVVALTSASRERRKRSRNGSNNSCKQIETIRSTVEFDRTHTKANGGATIKIRNRLRFMGKPAIPSWYSAYLIGSIYSARSNYCLAPKSTPKFRCTFSYVALSKTA